jgi:hypothetical protein
MKTKLFMWLVHHKKILTWDNIRKRGILGPSICQLCKAEEETMEHILNSCISPPRYGIYSLPFFNRSIGTIGVSSIPSIIGEETFWTINSSAWLGP